MTQAQNRDEPFVRLGEALPQAGQIALVDGALVPLMQFDLPPRLRGQAREDIARRQLRDRLGAGGDALELHPCPVDGEGERWTRALVADAATLAEWRATAGAAPKAVLPDYLALPTAANLWTVSARTDRVLVRLGPQDGFSATPEMALAMLDAALGLSEAGAGPTALLLQGTAPEIAAVMAAHDIPVIAEAGEAAHLDLAPPRILGHGEAEVDLRRDPQLARALLSRQVLPWRWTLLAGIVTLGLWSATELLEITRTEARTRQLQAETEALVRAHFVPTGPILDVRVQVARAVSGTPTDTEAEADSPRPLELLRPVAEVVSASEAQAATVTYGAADGLELVVDLSDFSAAARLQTALADAGLVATRQAAHARATGNGVRAVFAVTDLQQETAEDRE